MARLAWTSEPTFKLQCFLSTVLLTAHLVSSGPTGQRSTPQCVSFCKEANNFNYEPSTTYVYEYVTDIKTRIIEGSDQESHVHVSASVELESLSPCNLQLKLKNVHFTDLTNGSPQYLPLDSDSSQFSAFEAQLESNPILAGFQDGKIEQICANQKDEVWVRNVKRGIISMIQNSLEDLSSSNILYEADINGRCPTEYILDGESWGGGVRFKKLKDLTKCTARQTQFSAIQSVPYTSSSPIQNIPLLTGHVQCDQTIRNKRIEDVQCQEEQHFKPFEQRSSGATTTIIQSLVYVSEHSAKRHGGGDHGVYIKKDLTFESEVSLDGDQDNARELMEIVDYLEKASFPQVTRAAPQLFVDLVEAMRKSSESSIRTVVDQTFETPKENYVLQALPLVETASSLAVLRDLSLQGSLQEGTLKSWLTSLAFIQHPTLAMIRVVSPVLEENPSTEAFLGISSLVNSYCKNNPSCNRDVVINDVLEKFTAFMGSSCTPKHLNAESIRQMIIRLKAIGNAGELPVSEEVNKNPVIIRCLKERTNPFEIRIAAIESLRRLSCSSYDNKDVIDLFTDNNENTEVRIKAFQAIMRCANRHTMELVKSVLYTESVNQVGSFVWTFLTNLQETNRPEKQEIRNLLSNEFLKNKFSTDARKFSRNYEASTFWNDWNVGAGLDSNIIFTEESFFPKSGMLNLTLQLFGESVNIWEFEVRAHGMEQLLEKAFGPEGYFPDNRVSEFLDSSRVKRSVSADETEGLGYLYDQGKTDEEEKVPGGSFYTRVFGHEIIYKDFEVSDKTSIPNVVDESGKSWFNIRSILDNLSTGKKSQFSKSMILLDSSYSVSTSSGFPLSLGVHTAATVTMIAKGKFNVGRFLQSKELDIEGTLRPSTTINVDGTLAILIGKPTDPIRSGLKLHNTLRSSTAVEVNLLVKGKNVLHASINVPQEKQEILDVSSELLLIGPNGQAPVIETLDTVPPAFTSNSCTSDSTSDIVGIKLCLEMNIPSTVSFTPLQPTFARLYLEKTDNFTGYTVDYQYASDHSSTKFNAVFDTAGSRINRRMAGDFLLDRGMGKIAFGLDSVTTALRAEGIYTQFQKNLELSLTSYEKTNFLLNTGIRNDGNIMKPHVLITWRGRPVMDLKGTVDMTPQSNNEDKIAIEINMKHLTETPVKVLGEMIGSGEVKEATLSIESYILTGNVRSQLRRKLGHWSAKTSMEYSWKKEKMHSADLSLKVQRGQKGSLAKTLVTAGFTSTQFPDNTLDFHWETQTSHGFCENGMKIGWGKTTWEGHTLFSRQNQVDHSELRFESSLTCTKFDIDYRIEFAHMATTEGFNTKFLGRLGTDNEFNTNIEYISAVDDLLRKSLDAGATWPNTEYTFKASFLEKQRGDFEAELLVHLNKTRDLKATAFYMNRSNNLKLDHNIDFRARGFTSVPISGSIGFSATEKQSHIGCQVQFEGKKPYSSRMSTSLDYSHTKYSHKLEGKVTLNERKYNGEILYKNTGAGGKNLIVDLQLEHHIFIEGSLIGMLPDPISATFLIVPDKDHEPDSHMKVEGNLDPYSVSATVDYFGEEMSFAGRYDEISALAEATWQQDKKFMIIVALPKFSFEEMQIGLDVFTPFDGYRNISFAASHQFDGENLKATVASGVESIVGTGNLAAVFSSREISVSTDLDITGYPKYQASILVLRKAKRKSFQIAFKNGDRDSLVDFDFIRLDEGYLGKFDFHGCEFLPEISMEINHQFSASRISSYQTQVQWTTEAENSQKVSLLVKTQQNPTSAEAMFTSPWNPVKQVDGSLVWDPVGENRQLSLTVGESLENVNAKILVNVAGSLHDFHHKLDGIWFSKAIKMTVAGGWNGISNSKLSAVVNLPDNRFTLGISSRKDAQKYIGEFRTDLDNTITSAGVKWDFNSESQKLASVWGQTPNFPLASVNFEYDTAPKNKVIKVKIISNEVSLVESESQFELHGTRRWKVNCVLKSTVLAIPSVTLSSEHDVMNLNKIKHSSKLQLIPVDETRFWLRRYTSTRHLSVDLAIDNLEDIRGTAIVDELDFTLNGKIEKSATGYESNLKVASNKFHEVNFQGTYSNDNGMISSFGTLTNRDNEEILNIQVDTHSHSNGQNGKFRFRSGFTGSIEGFAEIQSSENSTLSVYLSKDQKNIFNFKASGLITPSIGAAHVKLTSTYFPSIALLQLGVDYKLQGTSASCKINLQDNSNIHAALIESSWGDDSKSAKISYDGFTSFSVEAVLEGMNELRGQATYEGRKLGEFSIAYRPEQGDYSYGTHGVYISVTDSSGTTQQFTIILGVDSKKVLLNMKTPFTNWTDVLIEGQMASSPTSKAIKFLLKREDESIQGSFESKNLRRTGTLQILSELSVVGFSKLRQILLETTQATNIKGLSAVTPQKFTFNLNWATSNFNVKVETPVDVLKKLAFSGNWELTAPNKFISVSGDINEKHYDLNAEIQLEQSKLKGKMSLMSNDVCSAKLEYDFSENYEAHLTIETQNNQWNVGGVISMNDDSLSIELTTPVERYESITISAQRQRPSNTEGVYTLSWDINGSSDKLELQYSLEAGRLELRGVTPIKPWHSLVITVIYDNPFHRLTFHSQRGDGKEVKVSFEMENTGNMTNFQSPASSSILLAIETPVEHFEDIKFSLLYDRKNLAHAANISISRNSGETEGKLNLMYQRSDPVALDISAYLTSPFLTSRATAHASLLVDPTGESTISAHVQANGRRYEMYGLSQFTNTITKLEMRTTLPFLRQLQFTLKKASTINLYSTWTGNNRHIEVHGDLLCGGLRASKLNFNVSTPVDLLGSFGFDGEVTSKTGSTSAALVFQNHEVRWLAKLDRLQHMEAEDWRLQVNTPLSGYKHVVASLKHSFTAQERNIIGAMQLNKKEMSLKLNFRKRKLSMTLSSELSYLPVQAKIESEWGTTLNLKVSANAGTRDFGTTLNFRLQGASDGDLDVSVSSLDHLSTRLDWKFEGDTSQGQGRINVKNPMIGSKSLRSSWKNKNWEEAKFNVWVKTGVDQDEKGVSIEYTVTPHEHYGSIYATANYTFLETPKSIVFEASLDEQSSHFIFDTVLKAEFNEVQTFKAKGELVLKSGIGFIVNASMNDETLLKGTLDLLVAPTKSGIVLDLDVPMVTDPLSLDASYDITSENKLISLLFKQVVYSIDLKLAVTIPNETSLVDVNLQAMSNVPALPFDVSGTLQLNFAVSNDGTRQVSVHLKSEPVGDWKLLASLRTAGNVHCKVIFEGPLAAMPTLLLEFNFGGNIRQRLTSDITVIIDGAEATGDLFLTKHEGRSSLKYSAGSDYNCNAEATFRTNSGHTQLDVRYNVNQDYSLHVSGNLNITKEVQQGNGAVTITSAGNTVIPVSLQVVVANEGNILISGKTNENNLRMEAQLRGLNDAPWVREGTTDFKLEGDISWIPSLSFQATHICRQQEYSLNVTTDSTIGYNLESYLKTEGHPSLFVQISPNGPGYYGTGQSEAAKLDVVLLPSNVDVLLKIPAWLNVHLIGEYGSTDKSSYINGIFHFNEHESLLNASLSTEGNNTICVAVLDIPSIKQKVDAKITTTYTGPQNLGGIVNLKVNEQEMQISANLKSQEFDSIRESYIERVVRLSSNFSIIETTAIGLEIFIRKPLKTYSSLRVISTLAINDETSTISGGYELPTHESNNTGLYFKYQNSQLVPEENYEFFLKSFGSGLKKLEGKLNYKLTRFDILWDFVKAASVVSISLSGQGDDGDRLFFQTEGIIDTKEIVEFSVSCQSWDTHYTFRTSLSQSPAALLDAVGYLYVDAPTLFESTNEYKISIVEKPDGSYTLEASAARGRLILELSGDAAISSHNFSVELKAMGSYGSHYAVAVGTRKDGQYEVELTTESSSLLVGKRVHIHGAVTIQEKGLDAVIHCRARRNIHTLSLSLVKENDNGRVQISMDSPSMDPVKFEVEWASEQRKYLGKVKIDIIKTKHQSEFELNLMKLEGKLHILSPLLPSSEFNFHLKSVVEAQNLDVLGDVRIRGSHWRLEGVASFTTLRDMTFKIEIRTPFEFLNRIAFGIKSSVEEIYLEIHTPATYIPNVMFKLTGLQGFEQGHWYALKPNLVISIPSGKYSAIGSLEMPKYETSGLLHVLFQYVSKESKTLEVYTEISPLKAFRLHMDTPGHLKIRFVTPFEALSLIKLEADGEINSKRSGKLQITGSLNSHNGKFDASFDNSNGNMQATTRLTTNIPQYEKSAFAIAIETFQGIGNGKSFHVEFRKPDWENRFRLDADYRYRFEGFLDLEGEVNVNMDSYMNLPPLHAEIKSDMNNNRYSGIIQGMFGSHNPSLKVETDTPGGKIAVLVEGKAGSNNKYELTNVFEAIPLQNDFSFRERLHWNKENMLDMAASLSDSNELFEGFVKLSTPWGPVNSKIALTPITFITMNEALSLSQLLKNTNVTVDVQFKNKKLIGLEVVSRDGMRLFEVHNPIRPVSLTVAVEKVNWNSIRLKTGVCWNLTSPAKSSLGGDFYMYKRPTGITLGGYIAGANYGIVEGKFEHFLISSKLAQNMNIQWNAVGGKVGEIGYSLNVTNKVAGFRRQMNYGLDLVMPSRSVRISGINSADDKNFYHSATVAWDAWRDLDKVLSVNISSQVTTAWRTTKEYRRVELRHVALSHPIILSVEKSLIHDSVKQLEFKIMPSIQPSSHLTVSSFWENEDWTSFSTSIEQPSSKINIAAVYNITEPNKLLKLEYMLFTGVSKVLAVALDKQSDSQKLSVYTGDSTKPRTMSSISTHNIRGEHSLTAQLLGYQVLGNVHTSLPYLDVTFRHDNANKVQFACGLPHPKEIVLKVSRSQYTKVTNDVSFLLRLNASNLLSGRLHWRPEIGDEIMNYDWIRGSKELAQNIFPSFEETSAVLREEIEGHWNLFSQPVKDFTSAMYLFSAYEINMFMEELQGVGERIQQVYNNNAFYIKDVIEVVSSSFSPLIKVCKKIATYATNMCKTVCENVLSIGRVVADAVMQYYGRSEELIMTAWENMEQFIIRFWRNNANWLQTISEELEEFVDALIEALEGKIDLLESKLMAVGIIKNIITIYRDYVTWFDEIPIDDYLEAIEDFFQVKVWNRLEELLGPYVRVISNLLDDDYLKELMETPPFPYIRFVLRQTKNGLVRAWEFIELEEKLKDLVRHALRSIDGLMQRNFPTWELVWEIDDGIIEYDQSLSFIEWVDFTRSPQWRMHTQEAEEVNQIANLYYQILDYMENLKPVFDMRIRDILPPFGGLAMMAGDHHYYTFDKKYFRFAGECSYVLVADMLNNGFSFIVNYQTKNGPIHKKSYTIALPNRSIEFDVDNFKVTVDSKKVELPIKVDTLYIRRQETRLDIYDVRGYQITCTLSPSVCTFSTSGWYYGELAGLLGTYDNEAINDLQSPDGQIITDVPTFAYSWRVGKNRNQCRMKNFAKDEVEPVDVDNICYDLLANRNSPLRPCFNTVDTTIFMEMCKYDISKNINSASRSESACTSMSAYVTECQKHNVDVWMPPTCIRCKLEDGTAFTTGENVTLETNGIQKPPSSSDVVILLEEKECADQLDLALAVSKLEAAFQAEGIDDNRYAIIGFGGQGIHHDAHIQTSSASVWSHSTLFKSPDKVNFTSMRKSDLYSAIHFASTMTYRAGVSKTLIAITCGDKNCGDSVRYADTLTLLVENDFQLHMLTPKPFVLKGKKKPDEANRILGFDVNGVYTAQHIKRGALVADSSLKRQLYLPKDLCTPLAVETNGTRFTTDRLSKKMLDVWSRRVAQTAHPTDCQRCECVPDRNGGSRLMCHQCVSPSLWKFMEEWKNYQEQEIDDDVFGLEILEGEPFMIPPN